MNKAAENAPPAKTPGGALVPIGNSRRQRRLEAVAETVVPALLTAEMSCCAHPDPQVWQNCHSHGGGQRYFKVYTCGLLGRELN